MRAETGTVQDSGQWNLDSGKDREGRDCMYDEWEFVEGGGRVRWLWEEYQKHKETTKINDINDRRQWWRQVWGLNEHKPTHPHTLSGTKTHTHTHTYASTSYRE